MILKGRNIDYTEYSKIMNTRGARAGVRLKL